MVNNNPRARQSACRWCVQLLSVISVNALAMASRTAPQMTGGLGPDGQRISPALSSATRRLMLSARLSRGWCLIDYQRTERTIDSASATSAVLAGSLIDAMYVTNATF